MAMDIQNVLLILLVIGLTISAIHSSHTISEMATRDTTDNENKKGKPGMKKIHKTDQEWKEKLTEEQYYVTREKGTEKPFAGKYVNKKDPGIYMCVACGLELFSSKDKFDSGTGWPSFCAPIKSEHIEEKPDKSLFMERTEILCPRCGAHLGHVFNDGPDPTNKRYCVNSASLKFKKT